MNDGGAKEARKMPPRHLLSSDTRRIYLPDRPRMPKQTSGGGGSGGPYTLVALFCHLLLF